MFLPEEISSMPTADLVSMGLVEDLESEAYHKAPGVSKSGLDRFSRSPAHYMAYLQGQTKETDALRFGRLFHRYILEPDSCRLAVWDGPARNTKEGKAAWAEFLDKFAGCEVVSAEDHAKLTGMRDAVYAHPAARDLLSIPGRSELSRWSYDPASGELCKCRPDRLLDIGMALDLKSTENASPKAFAKSCADYRYHVQAAYYPDVLDLDEKRFPFIAVEKSAPYAVGVYELSPEDVEMGRYLYQRDLLKISECKISKSWPAYSEQIEPLTLPAWATKSEI